MRYEEILLDHTVYIKYYLITIVYIDDIILTRSNNKQYEYLNWFLAKKFEINIGKWLKYQSLKIGGVEEDAVVD